MLHVLELLEESWIEGFQFGTQVLILRLHRQQLRPAQSRQARRRQATMLTFQTQGCGIMKKPYPPVGPALCARWVCVLPSCTHFSGVRQGVQQVRNQIVTADLRATTSSPAASGVATMPAITGPRAAPTVTAAAAAAVRARSLLCRRRSTSARQSDSCRCFASSSTCACTIALSGRHRWALGLHDVAGYNDPMSVCQVWNAPCEGQARCCRETVGVQHTCVAWS